MNIRVKLLPGATMPTRATPGAAGLDLYTNENCFLVEQAVHRIATGVCLELPWDGFAEVAPRSSMSASGVLCHRGIIDSDYRGQIFVLLQSFGPFGPIKRGDRIAQLLLHARYPAELVHVEELTETERGANGFGSTGR